MFKNRLSDLKDLYRTNSKDDLILDIQLDNYRDVYSDWDFAPFQNRDLDDDFVEYLLESSLEIPLRYKFKVVFFLPNEIKNKKREHRSTEGIRHYFEYEYNRNRRKIFRMLRDTFGFFITGSLLIVLAVFLETFTVDHVLMKVVTEGLYIGGWVMMWEMFSAWFFDVKKLRKILKHYKRLQEIEYAYSYLSEK